MIFQMVLGSSHSSHSILCRGCSSLEREDGGTSNVSQQANDCDHLGHHGSTIWQFSCQLCKATMCADCAMPAELAKRMIDVKEKSMSNQKDDEQPFPDGNDIEDSEDDDYDTDHDEGWVIDDADDYVVPAADLDEILLPASIQLSSTAPSLSPADHRKEEEEEGIANADGNAVGNDDTVRDHNQVIAYTVVLGVLGELQLIFGEFAQSLILIARTNQRSEMLHTDVLHKAVVLVRLIFRSACREILVEYLYRALVVQCGLLVKLTASKFIRQYV